MAKEIGVITMSSGSVLIKTPDGKFHEAKVGEVVHEGDIVIGTARIAMLDGSKGIDINGTVALDQNVFAEVPVARADAAIQPQSSDVIVQALERGTDLNQTLDATAAGLGAGGEGGGSTFVQLSRLLETVTGNQYGFGFEGLGNLPITEGVGEVPATTVATLTTTTPTTPDTPTDPKDPPTDPKDPPTDPKDPPTDPKDPPTDPKDPPKEDDKDHKDNGKGNGIDDAPGNSGDHKGDDADGSNTPGTKDTSDPKHEVGEENHPKEENPTPPKEEDDTQGSSDEHKDGEHDSGSSGGSETDDDEKPHEDNGKGNGIDDAPGNSGDTKGDDADGSNTPGTDDTDVIPMPVDQPKGNNGWGNGDQTAPGNSGPNNNAENNTSGKEDPSHGNNSLDVKDLLVDDAPGNSGSHEQYDRHEEILLSDVNISDLLKNTNHGHND